MTEVGHWSRKTIRPAAMLRLKNNNTQQIHPHSLCPNSSQSHTDMQRSPLNLLISLFTLKTQTFSGAPSSTWRLRAYSLRDQRHGYQLYAQL